jgi:hypothetical protein
MPVVLFERFVEAASEVMTAAGWSADATGRNSTGASFVRPIGEGFVAVAVLEAGRGPIHGSREGRVEPPLNVFATVGVSHPMADRLVRAASGDRGWGPAVGEDLDELLHPPRDVEVEVAKVEQIRPAVVLLMRLVEEVATPYAQALASFDALLAELRAYDDAPSSQRYIPALLAVSGRRDEAREALAQYSAPADAAGYRSFASQLTRLLGGDVTLEELEEAIPPEPEPPVREPFSWGAAWEQVHSERAAVDTVRSSGAGATRERRRDLLRAELDRRELRKSPSWIEAKLDQLEPGYQPASTLGGIVALGKFAIGITKAIKNVKTPPEEPAWMAPPERACYRIFTLSRERVAVELDDDAREWLDRVHAAAPSILGNATVTVWLDHDGEAPSDRSGLIVSIGARRVGRLTPGASAAFVDSMAAAATRDELPFTPATLTRRASEPRFVLEIATPADPGNKH